MASSSLLPIPENDPPLVKNAKLDRCDKRGGFFACSSLNGEIIPRIKGLLTKKRAYRVNYLTFRTFKKCLAKPWAGPKNGHATL